MYKSIVITLTVCLVAVFAQNPVADPRCPAGVPAAPLLFPHPTDCSLFLSCSNGFAFTVACQPGLHFSPPVSACRWAHEVNCTPSGPTPTPPTTSPITTPTIPTPAPTPGVPGVTDPAPDVTTTAASTDTPLEPAPPGGGTPAPVIPPSPPVIPV